MEGANVNFILDTTVSKLLIFMLMYCICRLYINCFCICVFEYQPVFQVLNLPTFLCLVKTIDFVAIVPQASCYDCSHPQLAAHALNKHLAKSMDFLSSEND